MNTLKSVLQEIQVGKVSFTPHSSGEQDMEEFQVIAKILLHADRRGLLESCKPHKESSTKNHWYDLVMVNGGLSYDGEQYLARDKEEDSDKELKEIIQLKPNIHGVGVDIKALWRRYIERKR